MFKDKPLSKLTYKNIVFIITYTVLLILAIMHIDVVMTGASLFFSLVKPFLVGFVLAYMFNIPMRFFLKKLPEKWVKGRKLIAAITSLLCIAIVLTFIVSVVVPQLVDNITILVENFPQYARTSEKIIMNWMQQLGLDGTMIDLWNTYSKQIEAAVLSMLDMAQSLLPKIIEMTGNAFSFITNLVMSLVVAIYVTLTKDTLIAQIKKTCYAFLKEEQYAYLSKVAHLSDKTFSSFISGQLLEALIIGVLCYLGAQVLRLEYALIIAVIVACTNIIPIFGPIIGTAVSAILLLFVSPMQSVVFIIFGILLQQFESNLIYPRVVGNSVGLSGMWVLLAVSVGGGLFGMVGMIFGLPVFAVLYRLFADEVERRTKLKKAKKEVSTSA